MLVQCNHCGAPLDVSEGTATVKCAYCDTKNRMHSMRTIAQQRPENWQPPPQWTPPPNFPAVGKVLSYTLHSHSRRTRAIPAAIIVGVLATLLAGLLPTVLIPMVQSKITSRIEQQIQHSAVPRPAPQRTESNHAAGAAGPSGLEVSSEPIHCNGGHSAVGGTHFRYTGSGPAVIARGNCRLSLANYKVTSTEGIVASGNAVVSLRNSELDVARHAIQVTGNARVRLVDVEVGAMIGIDAARNAEVIVQDGRIDADETAARAGGNAQVTARDTTMNGKVACSANGAVTVDGESRCGTGRRRETARPRARPVRLQVSFERPNDHHYEDGYLRRLIVPAIGRMKKCYARAAAGSDDDQWPQEWMLRVDAQGKAEVRNFGGDVGPGDGRACVERIIESLPWDPPPEPWTSASPSFYLTWKKP